MHCHSLRPHLRSHHRADKWRPRSRFRHAEQRGVQHQVRHAHPACCATNSTLWAAANAHPEWLAMLRCAPTSPAAASSYSPLAGARPTAQPQHPSLPQAASSIAVPCGTSPLCTTSTRSDPDGGSSSAPTASPKRSWARCTEHRAPWAEEVREKTLVKRACPRRPSPRAQGCSP